MSADDHPLFMISTIAAMFDIHPQTLRLYERRGFITPTRTQGNTRLYAWKDVQQIRLIIHLTRDCGINLAGVDIILSVQQKLDALHQDIDQLQHDVIELLRRDYATPPPPRALVKSASRTLVKVQAKNR